MEGENNVNRREKKKKNKKRKRLDVKTEILPEQPDKIAPLVGYFPTGFDPQKARTSEEDDPKVRVFRNKNRPNRLQLVVSPNGSNVEFVGTNFSGEGAAAQVCTYALGVLDKETQSLKIVPIASNKVFLFFILAKKCLIFHFFIFSLEHGKFLIEIEIVGLRELYTSIFRLEPRVRGSDLGEKEPSNELKEEHLAQENRADRIRDLTNLYGTKKSITRANKLESLNQKEDPSAQKDLDRKIEGVVINKEALESAGAYTARNIPPHDSTATTPEKAYPLEKIILKGEWDYLLDVLELIQSEAEIDTKAYPSFVCNRFHKLGEIQDEVEKRRIACIFSYITHLIKFKDQRSADGIASAKYHKLPAILFQKFFGMFADSEKGRMSDEKNNLLISYVLVLTLIADEFQTDTSDIASDLRLNPMSLRMHYQHLGCKLSRVDKLLLATLPVPLEFPKVRAHRRRR
ncbi:hypothetical protein HHK36_028633 [Tetracentron sinense]|uniref:DNA-directed RNA polymerase I subunit rpa49 n=1 Tax=Tetracentron sinense TaxID=13715 RepID=A0A834YDH6_TETSI|nr:hypothetical protein HHK36_028633 [Tetracentron sinense]